MTKTDRGLYRCVADNQVRPPDEYLVAVNVFFKPDTIAVQDSVGQAADRQFDAKLECRVSGIYKIAHDYQLQTCFMIVHTVDNLYNTPHYNTYWGSQWLSS